MECFQKKHLWVAFAPTILTGAKVLHIWDIGSRKNTQIKELQANAARGSWNTYFLAKELSK